MPWLPLADRHRNAIELWQNAKSVLAQQTKDVEAAHDALAQVEAEIWGKASGWEECDPCVITREQNPHAPMPAYGDTAAHVPPAPPEPPPPDSGLGVAHGAPADDEPPHGFAASVESEPVEQEPPPDPKGKKGR